VKLPDDIGDVRRSANAACWATSGVCEKHLVGDLTKGDTYQYLLGFVQAKTVLFGPVATANASHMAIADLLDDA